jgi:hypothetical protein
LDGKAMTETSRRINAAPRKGRGWILFGAFALMGVVGLALDLMTRARGAFWIGAEPGARAVIGVGAAAFMLLCAHAARFILAKREPKGARDAGDHA